MVDERTMDAASASTQRQVDSVIERQRTAKTTYVIVAPTVNNGEPFTIVAQGANARTQMMAAKGIDVSRHDWAAGHLDGRGNPQVCGRHEPSKRRVEQELRRKR